MFIDCSMGVSYCMTEREDLVRTVMRSESLIRDVIGGLDDKRQKGLKKKRMMAIDGLLRKRNNLWTDD